MDVNDYFGDLNSFALKTYFQGGDAMDNLIDTLNKPKTYCTNEDYPMTLLRMVREELLLALIEPDVKNAKINDALDKLRLLQATLLGEK